MLKSGANVRPARLNPLANNDPFNHRVQRCPSLGGKWGDIFPRVAFVDGAERSGERADLRVQSDSIGSHLKRA